MGHGTGENFFLNDSVLLQDLAVTALLQPFTAERSLANAVMVDLVILDATSYYNVHMKAS